MANSPSRVKALRAHADTVHDAAATEHAERIVQISQTLGLGGITAVHQEAVSLQQACGANKLIRVPPERRASRGTACA